MYVSYLFPNLIFELVLIRFSLYKARSSTPLLPLRYILFGMGHDF